MQFAKGNTKMTLKPGMYHLQNGVCLASAPVLGLLLATEEKQILLNPYQNSKEFIRKHGRSVLDKLVIQGNASGVDPCLLFSLLEAEDSRNSVEDTVTDESRWSLSMCRRLTAAEVAYKQKTLFDPKIQNVYTQAYVYYFLGVETGDFSVPKAQKIWEQYAKYVQLKNKSV